MTFGVIAVEIKTVPAALYKIFIGAFSPASVTGGVIGSAFVGIRFGMSRGVFSNEAGLGTAPIAYACSNDNEIRLGLMGIVEVFIDTIVICTMTALVILCTHPREAPETQNLTYHRLLPREKMRPLQ